MARDTIKQTFMVAAVLCIVCSVLVSWAAVSLRPLQEVNKELDKKKNILEAAGLLDDEAKSAEAIEKLFAEKVGRKLIDLSTGDEVTEEQLEELGIDLETYEQKEAAGDPALNTEVEPPRALPGISEREKFAFVYLVNDESGNLAQMVFPVYGKGLWSTLYGFIAVESDTTTVSGITFYQHGETPGLGGEVDNRSWKAQWKGKKLYNDNWDLEIEVLKGKVNKEDEDAVYQIDGLSGATITTRGVTDLVRYWLGEDAFGPYLEKIRNSRNAS